MHKSRWILFVVFFVLGSFATAHAQITANLIVTPNPSSYISDWTGHPEYVTLSIINPTNQTYLIQLQIELSITGELVARSKRGLPSPINVPPGVTRLTGTDIISMPDVDFFGSNKNTVIRTGVLPSGVYEFCITLFNAQDNKQLTRQCKPLTIQTFAPPILLQPQNNAVTDQATRPIFHWTSVNPPPPKPIIYVFTLTEVFQSQRDPVSAFRMNRPLITKELVNQTLLPLPAEIQQLDTAKTYVWSVKALDQATRNPVGTNDGLAQPFMFTVKKSIVSFKDGGTVKKSNDKPIVINATKDSVEKKSNKPPPPPRDTSSCGACSAVALTDTSVATATIAVNDTIKVGTFDMIVTEVTDGTPTNASGKGSIKLSWLFSNVLVEFKSLKISGSHQMMSGDVKSVNAEDAPTFPKQLGINAVLSNSWTKGIIASLDSYLKLKGKISSAASSQAQALKTPIGVNNFNGYTLCISEMVFTKDNGILTAVASIPITSYDDTLSFGVTNLPFCTAGLSHKGSLELLKDFTFHGANSNENSFKVALKARSSERDGCFISWGCNGFDTLSVDLDILFPRTWLVPKPDANQLAQAIASFSAKTVKWKDWILKGNLPPCTIVGTNGVGLEIANLALDLSDGENAPAIVFPANYVGTKDDDFKGLSAQTISLTMPDGWRTFDDPDKAPVLLAKNLIIAKTGLTGDFIVANVIQYPKGDIARMSASLDTVCLSLVNTSLTKAYVVGKINLPIGEADQGSALTYKALFNVAQKKFDFTIKPDKDITTNLFAGAKLTLKETSIISITLSKTEKKFSLTLNGSVGWSDQEITVPLTSKKIKLNLAPTFENVQLIYDDKATPQKITFNKGTWSFASPQKKLAGFPVSLKNVAIETLPTTGTELCAAALKFDLTVNLDSNRIGGDGTFRIMGAIDKSSGDSKFKFKPKFKDFKVEKITIFANLSAVKINGTLEFYDSDPKWGTGFYATIKATFSSMQMELSANARFGMKSDYRYWFIEAKAILPTGIPFMTGYAFYGAGVAAWYHINCDMTGAKPSATAAATTSASSGAVMSPDKNVGLGFKVLAVLGTNPDPARMNADIAIAAQFSSSGGILNLGISGSLWMMAKFPDRNDAPVKGTLNVSYDFPNKIFDLNASVTINRPPITGSGTLKINVNGTTGKWYVKIGDPTQRVTVSVNLLGSTISSHSYFMFGNNITPPSSFMPTTIAGLQRAGCSINNSMLSSATNSVKTGPGLATGFEIGFTASGNINIVVASINWNANAGAEANLSMLRYDGTPCPGFTGYNHWYVRGSLAVYGGVSVVMHVSPWNIGGGRIYHPCCGNPLKSCFYDWSCYDNLPVVCLHCCGSGCNYNLATINIGAYLNGGFPNPSWVEGSVAGNYNLLGGLISGSFTANFSKGSKCTP